MNSIIETTYETFSDDVIRLSFQQPVLVDVWAEWCPPCIIISPILTKIVSEYNNNITLAKLEVDEGENMKIAGQYQIRGFPSILLIQNGEEKARFSGAKSESFIKNFIQEYTIFNV